MPNPIETEFGLFFAARGRGLQMVCVGNVRGVMILIQMSWRLVKERSAVSRPAIESAAR